MKLSGSAAIAHPVRDVFAALTDPAMLVRTLPGCQRLEQVGPDAYEATMSAGVGSIKGVFDGGVKLTDLAAPDSFTLHASGAGVPGTVDAVAHVRLVPDPAGGTLVHYAADAAVGGVIGGVGQRMLAGVARRTAGEFFAAVDRELTAGVAVGVAVSRDALATPGVQQGVLADIGSLTVPSLAELRVGRPSSAATAAVRPPAPRTEPVTEAAATPADEPPALPVPQRTVWTRPAPERDPVQQRVREMVLAACFGAGIALLGVLIGALVARW
jgi:carbon monoxide dehydrogenase subunit G